MILSTHIVQDVKELCTHMAIINHGRVLFSGSPAEAEHQVAGKIWCQSMSKQQFAQREWKQPILSTKLVAGSPMVRIYSETDPGNGFQSAAPDLEDVFFSHLSQA